MIKQDLKLPSGLLQWLPVVKTLETGEITMLWQLDVEPGSCANGGAALPVSLSYRDVQVHMQWISEGKCSLDCRGPGMKSRKHLHDSGYRGILAIDRYAGRVIAINGIERSTWWLAVLGSYCAYAGPRSYDSTELMNAAGGDDVPRVERLLASGTDIEGSDLIGVTALCSAAESGALDTFRVLLERGANPKIVTSWRATLLHAAAAGGNTEIISMLVNKGADLNARDLGGHTALSWAVSNRKAGAAEYLLRAGADPAAEQGLNLCDEARLWLGKEHPVTSMICGSVGGSA